MQKRGQVAVYVVFGIIVVALAVLIIFFRARAAADQWEQERLLAMAVPEKAMEVYSFGQSCVQSIADNGVTLLGMQGGYIDIPATEIPPTPAHPFGKTLEIIPGSGMKTAYWFYAEPNGIQKTSIPTIKEMEASLAEYVNSRLGECTQNFTLFEKYNLTQGRIKSTVNIKDAEVQFTVDYPVKIEIQDFNYRLPKFYAKVDARIGEMYNIGKEIISRDSNDFYLEEKTIDILAVYKGIPFSGTEITCAPKVWTKSKVMGELKKALNSNMQFIKLGGTAFSTGSKYFAWDALEDRHGSISSGFKFSQEWPVKMEVYPSEGEILTAEPLAGMGNSAMAFLTSIFCINDYNFIYDIQYPLLVALTDTNGHLFQFATMVVIDNNQPRENREGTLDIPEPENKICGNKAAHAKIYALSPDANGNLNPVADAEISLKCVSTVCNLGRTKADRRTGEAVLEADIPPCANALLTASKEGFHDGRETASTIQPDSYSVKLEPYKEMDYEIKVMDKGFERGVESSETVIINIENEGLGFGTSLVEPKGKIRLIAGSHDLSTTLITQGFEINIKGKEITHCIKAPTRNILGLLGFEEERCTTASTPDMALNQVVSGGSSTVWQVTRKALDEGSKVIFYVPAGDVPGTVEDMEEAYDSLQDPSKALQPVIE
ncbi:MAG TPA: hypothetical protein HA362_07410 [Nanoarchaeota archaeon]|nr:hypothetical protein [Nanoarchaeota archaeon]